MNKLQKTLLLGAMLGTASASAFAQQSPDLLPAFSSWNLSGQNSSNPVVYTTISSAGVGFQSACSSATPASCTNNAPFTVTVAGRYHVSIDAEWTTQDGAKGLWSASIAGYPSGQALGSWTQSSHGGASQRDMAQWVAELQPGSYFLYLNATVSGCDDVGVIRSASIRRVEGPVLLPNSSYAGVGDVPGYADFVIDSGQTLQSPLYLLFSSPAYLPGPVSLPFGSVWLAAPTQLAQLTTPGYSPLQGSRVGAALYGLLAPATGATTWWQVLEFDLLDPLNTLRLGSLTATRRP